jgi:hypothetical protein
MALQQKDARTGHAARRASTAAVVAAAPLETGLRAQLRFWRFRLGWRWRWYHLCHQSALVRLDDSFAATPEIARLLISIGARSWRRPDASNESLEVTSALRNE